MKIHYVTSNKGKFEEAVEILKPEIDLVHTPLHLDELQGTSQEIAFHKIDQAYSTLKEACLIDDISVFCPALGGLPGPYIRAFLESIGPKGLAELIHHYPNRRCSVVCQIAYKESPTKQHIFEGTLHGTIVPPRGERLTHTHSWNAIVQPDGFEQTFAEMTLLESSRISARSLALSKFKKHILGI